MFTMRTKTISFFLLFYLFFYNMEGHAGVNPLLLGEIMNFKNIFCMSLKIKDKFSKKEIKTEIKDKNEIELISDGIIQYKEKRLLDLICEFQLLIYSTETRIVKVYDIGTFVNNKGLILVRDKDVNEDYILDGTAADLIYKYSNLLKSEENKVANKR